jgi:hypothetical protein
VPPLAVITRPTRTTIIFGSTGYIFNLRKVQMVISGTALKVAVLEHLEQFGTQKESKKEWFLYSLKSWNIGTKVDK